MKKIIFLFVCFSCSLLYAQEIDSKIFEDSDFLNLKEKSIEFGTSQNYRDQQEYQKIFREKINYYSDYDRSDFAGWLEKNLSATTFESIEEGVELHKKIQELQKENSYVQKELAKMRNDLSDKYGHAAFLEVYSKEIAEVIVKRNVYDSLSK